MNNFLITIDWIFMNFQKELMILDRILLFQNLIPFHEHSSFKSIEMKYESLPTELLQEKLIKI